MKKLILILMIFVSCFISCKNFQEKKVRINFTTSYKSGYPNIYIENAKLFSNEKDLGDITIFNDGELKHSGMFIGNNLSKYSPGTYVVKWSAFSKNGLGSKLDRINISETIKVSQVDSLNEFSIIGDKLYNREEYKLYLKSIAFVDSITEKIETDSIYIIKNIDEMTDKVTYMFSRELNLIDNEKNARIFIPLELKNNKFSTNSLCIKMDIGSQCVEDNKIIIMFDSGKKISLTSWNDFNCDGNAYFNISSSQCKLLSTELISKIRIVNGSTYNELNSTLDKNKDFFVQVFYAMNNNKLKK